MSLRTPGRKQLAESNVCGKTKNKNGYIEKWD
jgi:hypothetical protein